MRKMFDSMRGRCCPGTHQVAGILCHFDRFDSHRSQDPLLVTKMSGCHRSQVQLWNCPRGCHKGKFSLLSFHFALIQMGTPSALAPPCHLLSPAPSPNHLHFVTLVRMGMYHDGMCSHPSSCPHPHPTGLISPLFTWHLCTNTNRNTLCVPIHICIQVSLTICHHLAPPYHLHFTLVQTGMYDVCSSRCRCHLMGLISHSRVPHLLSNHSSPCPFAYTHGCCAQPHFQLPTTQIQTQMFTFVPKHHHL